MKITILNKKAKLVADEADKGKVSGYASVFGGVDCVGDTIMPNAYDNIISENIMPKMFFNHEIYSIPVGKWESIEKDDVGLKISGHINLNTQAGRDLYESIKFGSVDGLSVRIVLDDDCVSTKLFDDDNCVRIIKNVIALPEVSLVTYPADKSARLTDIKSELDNIDTISNFEKFLRDACVCSKSEATAIVAKAKKICKQNESESHEENTDLKLVAEKLKKITNLLN